MPHSKRMRQTIGMRIDCFVHGIIERLAEKVLPRLRFNTHKGSEMALFKCLPVFFFVQPLGPVCNTL